MSAPTPDPHKRSFAYRLVHSFFEMARDLQALRRELLAGPALPLLASPQPAPALPANAPAPHARPAPLSARHAHRF